MHTAVISKRPGNTNLEQQGTEVVPPPPAVRQALVNERAVEAWKEKHWGPGYEVGATNAPGMYQKTMEVSSWLQVPEILKELHTGSDNSIRLKFPATVGESAQSIKNEQTEIRKFLQDSHGKPLARLVADLENNISSSASFAAATTGTNPMFPPGVTAKGWITAVWPETAQAQNLDASKKLEVTDIVKLGKKHNFDKQENTAQIETALKESVSSSRPVIFTVHDNSDNTPRLFNLAKKLEALTSSGRLSTEATKGISIRVGPDNKLFDRSKIGTECADKTGPIIRHYSFKEFLETYGTNGTAQRGSGVESPEAPPANNINKLAPQKQSSDEMVLSTRGTHKSDPNTATSGPSVSPDPLSSTRPKEELEADKLKIGFDIVSLRERVGTMPAIDTERLASILDSDPSLETIRSNLVEQHPGIKDLSPELAEKIAQEMSKDLSPVSKPVVATLVDFYCGYLRPFPDVTETEPLQSLMGYIKDLPTWDVLMAQDKTTGRVIGACSGQIVDVPCARGEFKIAWNEHTWVDKDARQSKIGSTLASSFTARATREGAIGVVIETDNPYLITKDERGFNHGDKTERAKFWTEELGQSMDPFNRFQFWGKQGFGVVVGEDGKTPAPYEQISMDLGKIDSCKTINLAFQPTSLEYQEQLPKDMYKAALLALQETIDENARFYPDLVRTMRQIDTLPGDTLRFVPLNTPTIDAVMIAARPTKEATELKDLEYCSQRLMDRSISEEEKEILSKTKGFLSGIIQEALDKNKK